MAAEREAGEGRGGTAGAGRTKPREYRAGMPLPDQFRAELTRELAAGSLISEPAQLRTYECDALTGHRAVPELVVIPGSVAEVQAVVRLCHAHGVPFVARGAGTGLSGGALPVADGIVISLARLNRVLEVDLERGRVVVEPGVTNLEITKAVAGDGFYYAPDPSSQQVCTIGGNVAENSGGAHCLKHGFTVNHVLAADVVLAGRRARHALARRRRPRPARRVRRLRGNARDRRARSPCGCCACPESGAHAARRLRDAPTRRATPSRT